MTRSPDQHSGSAERSSNSNPANTNKDRSVRKYGFACANCRKRKAKCDGGIPSCERCLSNGETCYFDKVPSVTYAVALQSRVDKCECVLNQMRIASDGDLRHLLEKHFSGIGETSTKRKRPSTITEPQQEESPVTEVSSDNELTEILNETSVDEDGRICFYGTTSLFHLQPDQATSTRTGERNDPTFVHSNGLALWERSFQWQNSLNLDTPSPSLSVSPQTDIGTYLNVDIDSQVCSELLDIYWCWPHHLHLVLCKKLFIRDLMTSGPYVTPFLLNAVLAQAARYSDRPEALDLGQNFAQRTLDTLAAEVDKGSSIPTIQGLLIFSARECACGRTSQGWLYSGMAFRMMRDMGIHVPPRKLSHLGGHFSPAELALRQQVFWSCYTWDKTMSLCLGRAPAMHDIIPPPTVDILLDGEEAENEAWQPKFAAVSALLEVGITQKARTNSRFVAYCQLCVIIEEVLATLYSKPHCAQNHLQGFLDRLIDKLATWVRGLSSHLFVREDSKSVSCPPLHILLLNLLYHATIILLCRPYRSKQDRARKMATTAAEMIDRLFVLHIRRFRFRVITYLESYTMFVASTINILDLKDGIDEEAAGARLDFCLEILRNATSTPSNARCVEIIQQLSRKDEGPNIGRQPSKAPQRPQQMVDPQLSPQVPSPRRRSSAQSTFSQQHNTIQHPAPSFTPSAMSTSQNMNDYAYLNMPASDFPTFYDQSDMLSSQSVQMPPDTQVDTPLRWLADNVGTNSRPELWMMMDMDFTKDYNNTVYRRDR